MRAWAAFLLLLPALAAAADGPGTSAAPILRLGAGARPAGMADAFVSVADDANASAWNPAGLASLPRSSAHFMFLRLYDQINYNYLAFGMPVGERAGWGAHIVHARTDAIDRTFEDAGGNFDPARSRGTFSNSNLKLNLAGAYAPTPWLALGAGGSLVQDSVDNDTAGGFLADLGLLAKPHELVSLGLAVQNMGSRFRGGDKPPTQLRAGASLRWTSAALLATQIELPLDSQEAAYSLGAEYWVAPALALRTGYRLARAADAGGRRFSLGMGLKVGSFGFDYAFSPMGALGSAHRAGLSFAFGRGRVGQEEERPRPRREAKSSKPREEGPDQYFESAETHIAAERYVEAKKALEAAAGLLEEEDQRLVRYNERTGRVLFLQGNLKDAKESFFKALRVAQGTGVGQPSIADAYAGLGMVLIKEGNKPYARKFFVKGLEAGPSPKTRQLIELQLKKLPAKP